MFIRSILLLFFLIIGSLTAFSNMGIAGTLYQGTPSFTKIPTSINQLFFLKAPNPVARECEYTAFEKCNHAIYSKYKIKIVSTKKNKFTHYKTAEFTGKNNYLLGEGVGYGGMFSMEYLKQGNLARQKNFYKKYQWYEISNVVGDFFPLKVGNQIRFDYKEYSKNNLNGPIQQDAGQIVYEVMGVIKDYDNSFTKIPGDVYIIKFSKSTKNNAKLLPQNIYHFSEKLGWYVYAEYYFAGKPLVEYKITNWR